jgi:IclR family transcriptional regulator, acetate operon repressor
MGLAMDILVEPKAPRVQSAARTVEILLALARSGSSGISAKKLSDDLDLPRQVVYHLVHTLVSVSMLRKSAGSAYVLGLAASVIANGYKQQTAAPEQLARYAEGVARLTGETAYMVGWIDDEVVVLAKANSPIQAVSTQIGATGEAHARASGKLLLVLASPYEVDRYLAKHKLTRPTVNTLTTKAALLRAFEKIREDQVSFDREEFSIGVTAIAVPVGRVGARFAIGLGGPTERVLVNAAQYIELLKQVANS